ncbi:hypothetical protein ACHHYP_20146 [Achlya hypogyna]|uniref:RED-like N-terminal domain-containing protein n=1 Tax=Achlya hypogyna TaxID=1202772 RepID=A0A1V9Z2P1_ACHHY|nr:hypothetical protein ACHHYP_20146 [Achlya hypogyna]
MSKLTQADFRRIMDTPLPAAGNAPRVLAGLPKKRAMTDDERKAKYKRLQKAHEPSDAPKPPKQPKLDPTYQGKYRDRAAERRSGGVDPDTMGIVFYCVPSSMRLIDMAPPANLVDDEIAQLVKKPATTTLPAGLDMNLLAQLKSEKAKLQKQHDAMTKTAPTPTPTLPPAPKIPSRMVQSIKYLLNPSASARRSDLFLPGRLCYSFNLLSTDIDALPSLVQRSIDDCPRRTKYPPQPGYVGDAIVAEIHDCMLANQGLLHRPKLAVPASPPPTAAAPDINDDDDDDDDIFADAGEYVPPGMRPEDEGNTAAVAKGEIFKNLSATLTAKAAADAAKEAAAARALTESIARAKKLHERAAEHDALREKHARLQKKLEGNDEYGECFPDYEEVEEDDDGGKKPKAQEEDKTQAWKTKVKQKEAKFEKELAQVEKIMKKGPKTPKPPAASTDED